MFGYNHVRKAAGAVFYKSVASIMLGLSIVADELEAHAVQCNNSADDKEAHIVALEIQVEDLRCTADDAQRKAKALRSIVNA